MQQAEKEAACKGNSDKQKDKRLEVPELCIKGASKKVISGKAGYYHSLVCSLIRQYL